LRVGQLGLSDSVLYDVRISVNARLLEEGVFVLDRLKEGPRRHAILKGMRRGVLVKQETRRV
jgi:hypothetical protein